MARLGRILIAAAGAVASAAAIDRLYRTFLREWVLTWGATAGEAVRPLPGDELLAAADIGAPRAIRIDAPPAAIWPWLVQMGPGRAGTYPYDWIENIFDLNMHSADRLHPEWQELEVGDVLRSGAMLSNRSETGDRAWTFRP